MMITNNTILITGGASGIGLALAKAFLEQENQVIICDKNKKRLHKVKLNYPDIAIMECDISDANNIHDLKKNIEVNFPQLNILIVNAGIQNIGNFVDDISFSESNIITEINTNLLSGILLSKAFLPILLEKKHSAIVFNSSLLAKISKSSAPVYCASKAGLHGFCKSLRYQLEKQSTKVFEIMPPIVETSMTAGRGVGKITADQLAHEFLNAFKKNKYQVEIGKTKMYYFFHRIFPKYIESLIRGG